MSVVIHHNPDCGTSRNVLSFLTAAGYEPVVVDYLKEGWYVNVLSHPSPPP